MSKVSHNSFGGLKVRDQNNIAITLSCEICKLLLLHPMQLLCCGARLCRWCSKQGLADSEPFICPFCNSQQPKKQVLADRGIERELNTTRIVCYSCTWDGSYKDYKEHLQENHADLECMDCGEHFIAINSYEEHRQEICEYRCIPCGLPGCTELVKWTAMEEHYLWDQHQIILLELIIVYFYPKTHLYPPHRAITSSNIISKMEEDLINIIKSIEFLLPAIQTLANDSERLRTEHNQTKPSVDAICSQIHATRKDINEVNEKIQQHQKSQDETEKELDNTKKLFSLTKIASLDDNGTITLCFSRTIDELKTPFSIFSSTFRTGTFGYPFILRLSSTIQSTNKDQQYLSIHMSLLRGEYDAILCYPFPYNISLCLCDQSGQRKHIMKTIDCKANESFFSRPTSERNDEIGIEQFCPLSYLTDGESIYLRDGIIFVRLFCDFMNTNQFPFT